MHVIEIIDRTTIYVIKINNSINFRKYKVFKTKKNFKNY